MRRWVAIGCSTVHDYAAFLPLAGLLWRNRIGYEPIFYLIGDNKIWGTGHPKVVFDALGKFSFLMGFVEQEKGIEDATMSQSIRLYAAAAPYLDSNDLLIPSDADLLPLNREFYYQHNVERYPIASYYANGYDESMTHLPSCHVSAHVETWREFMNLNGSSPRESMLKGFEERNLKAKIKAKEENPQANWGHVWFEDEFNLSARVRASKFHPDGLQLIRREGQPPRDRIDRSCWPASYNVLNYSDCHSLRPMWSDENWARIRPIFEQTMPSILDWADQYRLDFKKAMGF